MQLATALVHRPLLLVLDEPFAGLDPIAAEKMVSILRAQTEEGVAVLFSSHQLDVVEHLCDDVVIIHQGRVILAGRVSQLRAASSRRYLEVSTAGPIGSSWLNEIPGASLVDQRQDRIRLLVDDGIDIESVAAVVANHGPVSSFSLEPPDLSEIFTAAVRR